MKLMVNTTLAASIVVVGEALALGRALGLDQTSMLDVLAESPVGTTERAKRTNLEKEVPQRHWHLNDPGVVPCPSLEGLSPSGGRTKSVVPRA